MTEKNIISKELIDTLVKRIKAKVAEGKSITADAVAVVGGPEALSSETFPRDKVIVLLEMIRTLEDSIGNVLSLTRQVTASNNNMAAAMSEWIKQDRPKEQPSADHSTDSVQP